MSGLREILEWAQKAKALEVLVSSGLPLKARVGLNWIEHSRDILSAHESKNLALSALPEKEKNQLLETGFATGSASFDGVGAIRYKILMHKTGVSSEFRFVSNKIPSCIDLGYPHVVQDLAKKPQGLIFLVGPALSGKTLALWSMLQVAAFEKATSISSFESGIEQFILGSPSSVRQFEVSSAHKADPSYFMDRSSQIMAFDLGLSKNIIESALSASENGKLAFVILPGLSLTSALTAAAALYPAAERSIFFSRLAAQFQGGVGLRLSSHGDQIFPSYEILIGTPEIRAALGAASWSELAEIMKTTGEKTGMRTMNQSLLQHLLRRKMEMRTAFELSPEPEDLDRLLAKVGI